MMKGSDPVVVNCDQHSQVLKDSLWKFFNAKYRVETVNWGAGLLKAHQLILDVFLPPDTVKKSGKMTIERHRHLETLLEFMYRGTVAVPEAKLEGLLAVAREFGFDMLVDAVQSAMSSGAEVETAQEPTVQHDPADESDTDAEIRRLYERWTRQFSEPAPSTEEKASKSDEDVEDAPIDTGKVACKRKIITQSAVLPTSQRDPRFIRKRKAVLASRRSTTWYKCPNCCTSFTNKLILARHLSIVHCHTVACEFTCERCELQFDSRKVLAQHQLGHSPAPLKCEDCGYTTNRKRNLTAHLRSRHKIGGRHFVCEACGKILATRRALDYHLLSHAPEKLHKCSKCDYSSNMLHYLTIHLDVVHGEGVSRFVCDKCGKRCSNRSLLDRHYLSHTKEKPHKCPHCDLRSSQKSHIQKHMNAVHGEGRFRCEFCGKSLLAKSLLDVHRLIHTNEKPFQCLHCSYRANRKENRDRHLLVVHGQGTSKFVCETCGRPCASKFQLQQHMRTHTKERPFKCLHCTHASSQNSALKQHMYIVHGVGPVQLACDVCSKRCQSKTDLARHRQTHN